MRISGLEKNTYILKVIHSFEKCIYKLNKHVMPKNSDIFPEKSVLGITFHKNNSIFPGFSRNLYN